MSTWGRAKPQFGGRQPQREKRDNDLVVFPNERKESEKHPDFTGQGLVGGVEMWVSMWVKRSKKTGEEFFSISVRPKDEARRESAQRQEQSRVQQSYEEDGHDRPQRETAPPRPASRWQKASPRSNPPAFQGEEEFIPEFGEQWEREP